MAYIRIDSLTKTSEKQRNKSLALLEKARPGKASIMRHIPTGEVCLVFGDDDKKSGKQSRRVE